MKKSYLIALFGLLLFSACNNQKTAETTSETEAIVKEAVIEVTDSISEVIDSAAIEAETPMEDAQ